MAITRRIYCLVLLGLAMTSLSVAQSTTSTLAYNLPGSEDTTTTAGVEPGSSVGAGEFVNEAVATSPPEEDFQNTALSAADENTVVGDVATASSYTGTTTLSAATTAGESSDETDSSGASPATTTPVLLAVAAACVVAIAAVAIIKKRADTQIPSPHTPVDKSIYYQVNVKVEKQSGFFHVKRQFAPTVCTL